MGAEGKDDESESGPTQNQGDALSCLSIEEDQQEWEDEVELLLNGERPGMKECFVIRWGGEVAILLLKVEIRNHERLGEGRLTEILERFRE